MKTEQEKKEKINPELKEVVVQRLLSSKLPENIKLSVGGLSEEPMSLSEIIEHVKKEDETGRIVIEMYLAYLKALKEGIVKKIQNE